jgi:hypothetical protein
LTKVRVPAPVFVRANSRAGPIIDNAAEDAATTTATHS